VKITIDYINENYHDYLVHHSYTYCHSVDEAKDIAQLTLIKAWQNLDSYNPKKSSLATWLFQIMKNTAIDKLRQKKNLVRDDIVEWNNFVTKGLNLDTIDIKDNLNKIRLKYRLYIQLYYLEGYSQDEIAKRTETPLGTVKSRIRIGLKELKQIYN
jgi:RNA polymerase sigma-70 factor (ECF subfamily)